MVKSQKNCLNFMIFIMANYTDEVKNMNFNSKELQNLMTVGNYKSKKLKNHESTDSVTFDKNGKIIKKEQLKVTKNAECQFLQTPNHIDAIKENEKRMLLRLMRAKMIFCI